MDSWLAELRRVRGGNSGTGRVWRRCVVEDCTARLRLRLAVVGVPEELFGERVCAVVVPVAGDHLDTETLARLLRSRGVTTEYLPEFVVAVERLEVGPGGKTDRRAAKGTALESLSRTAR